MLVFFALGNTKELSFALADAKVPNASSFAFWWNIGPGEAHSVMRQPHTTATFGPDRWVVAFEISREMCPLLTKKA